MYRYNHNWEVIRLLLLLRGFDGDYPQYLFESRRAVYVSLVRRVVLYARLAARQLIR